MFLLWKEDLMVPLFFMQFLFLTTLVGRAGCPLPAQPASTDSVSRYTVQDIGSLPVGDQWLPTSINDKGVIVGVALNGLDTMREKAFVWRQGKMTALTGSGGASYAREINNRGDILGEARGADAATRPLIWPSGKEKAPRWLSDKKAGHAYSLNQKGTALFSEGETFLFWPSRTALSLKAPEGKFVSLPHLNDREEVAGNFARLGGEFSATIAEQPFLWQAGKITLLPTLGGRSFCMGLNNAGVAAGWTETSERVRHACVWKEGVLQDLSLPEFRTSEATAINDSGIIVGHIYTQQIEMRAYLWKNGEAIDLNTRIPADSGWKLNYADGINNRGQIIGSGYYKGHQHGFVLTPSA